LIGALAPHEERFMKLHYSKGSCSLASHIALEEAGARFEAVRINLQEGEQRTPEYLRVNPKGKVPALEVEGGVITENPAIISYVADTHPGARLLAEPGKLARARAQEWLAWCASTVHPSFGPLYRALREKAPIDDAMKAPVQANFDLYDRSLAGRQFVLGEFGAADAYTLVFTLWAGTFGLRVGNDMLASARALLERPGVQRAVKTQELTFSL
jgi:glutathione S-transferase